MSDQEKKSGSAADTSVVVVEQQSTTSRHKQPFRPVDLQDDTQHESHHKRSKAPAVPSVTDALKDSVINPEVKERKDSERAMSSEKHSKHTVSKKQSSSSKRRGSSAETVVLQPLEVDVKPQFQPDSGAQLAQPIPEVTSAASKGLDIEKKDLENKDDEDSITDEIAEMRTPEAARDIEEYEDIPIENINDKVSWNESDYLDKVQLEDATRSCILESKSSIGPCFRSSKPFGRPSGISLCLSRKSVCNENNECQMNQSMIMISLSRKCLINKTLPPTVRRSGKIDIEKVKEVKSSCFTTIREKFASMGGKIRNAFP